MSPDTHRILFSGKTLDNISLEVAKSNLQRLLKTNRETVERLFSGKTVVIRKELQPGQVEQYVTALNKAGVAVEVDPPLPQDASSLELEAIEATPRDSEQTNDQPAASAASSSANTQNPYSAPATQNYQPQVHCRQCGAKLDATDKECFNCGAKQLVGKSRSKYTAGLLAIFFGWLGVHRFYLGQWWGIFYFLFGVLSWLVAIVEGLVFLFTPKDSWDIKYGDVKGLNPALMAVVVILVLIPVVGILAAVAIPAYQDYTLRAQVNSAMPIVNRYKGEVSEFIQRTSFIPNSNLDAGLPENISDGHLQSLAIESGGRMVGTFQSDNDQLNGETIVWVPAVSAPGEAGATVTWDCSGGTLMKRFRPTECREGMFQSEQLTGPVKTLASRDGRLQVSVPESWNTLELNEDASLQAGNIIAESYFVAIEDSKADLPGFTLKDYADAVIESHAQGASDSKVKYTGAASLAGMEAIRYRVDSVVEELNLNYFFVFAESDEHYYQLISWSLASRFSGNEADMQQVINSFTER